MPFLLWLLGIPIPRIILICSFRTIKNTAAVGVLPRSCGRVAGE
jgi:hypothetical protein